MTAGTPSPGAVKRPVVCKLHLHADGRPCWREPPACPFGDGAVTRFSLATECSSTSQPKRQNGVRADATSATVHQPQQHLRSRQQAETKVIESFQTDSTTGFCGSSAFLPGRQAVYTDTAGRASAAALLGRKDNNYATMLPGSYVVVGGRATRTDRLRTLRRAAVPDHNGAGMGSKWVSGKTRLTVC